MVKLEDFNLKIARNIKKIHQGFLVRACQLEDIEQDFDTLIFYKDLIYSQGEFFITAEYFFLNDNPLLYEEEVKNDGNINLTCEYSPVVFKEAVVSYSSYLKVYERFPQVETIKDSEEINREYSKLKDSYDIGDIIASYVLEKEPVVDTTIPFLKERK